MESFCCCSITGLHIRVVFFCKFAPRELDRIKISVAIKPKRIQEAPVAFECEKITFLQISPDRHIVVGKVVMMHVRDGLFDPETYYINPEKYNPIGRMFGQLYTRTRDHFSMSVPSYADWQEKHTP